MTAERAPRPVAVPVATQVTAIVVTYNGRHQVGACLTSLLAGDPGLEVLVVDNASTDGTPNFVRAEFPGVQLLELPVNLGYGAAINFAARRARTPYLAILNQDLVCRPGWLAHLVTALEADPSAALATPKILLLEDPTRVNTCGNAPHYTGITACRGFGAPARAFTQVEELAAVSGAAFVIRREVFEALGGFDARFFLYLEDTDLSLRALLAGHHLLLVPAAEVLHDFAPRFAAEKLFWLERNRAAMLLKLFHGRTLLLLSPALLLADLAVWGYALLRGPRHLLAKAHAHLWVLGHLPELLADRRRTQATRRRPDHALLAYLTPDLDPEELGSPLARLGLQLLNPLLHAWRRLALEVATW